MKQILFAAAALAVLATPASATAKSPIEGRWKRGNLVVQIAPCGRELCGTVIRASAKQQAKAERGSGTDLIGARLIKDIDKTGPNSYRASVFLPNRNMHARGTIKQVSANQLAVRGCVLGVVCKSQTWQRVR
ncbi:MAG TPA: DUF2147 domain-containing protein [Sphingomicrobium sp.]|nr:DUF2147 domain-containing protein [Sphingomicrobium sp.]